MSEKKLIIFMPSIENGGVEKNLFIISNFLSLKIKNIELITFDKKSNHKFQNIKIINPSLNNKTLNRKVKYLFCLIELFKILIKNQKCIVFAFQANLYCALLCLFFPKTKLITRSNSSPSGWSKNIIKITIFKILFKRIDQVIVNSKEFQKEVNSKFNIKSKYIYNPLNKREILSKSKEKINFKFFKSKDIKIINIGRLVDQKNQIIFLKSLNLLKNKINFKALIIGNGYKKKELQKYINDNNLKKNIKIINFNRKIFSYIKLSNLLIHTAKYEGLPNVLIEAMTLKKYIISSKCPTGPKEILKYGKVGSLVEINNYKDIANKIIFFLNNKKTVKRKIKNGFSSLDRFDYKLNLNKYFKIIKKFL